jgi:Type I phosphodiesterase / nucleotide pyrophosphatase
MNQENSSASTPTGIFILIDALGWSYLKDSSFLADLLPYRTSVQTILGFSSGAIPVLLSGRPPKDSGHWNLFYYDPKNSPFRWIRWVSFLPKSLLNNRIVRRGVREVTHLLNKFGGYFQIYGVPVELLPYFDICEKKDIYRPGGLPGSLFDRLEQSKTRYRTYSYHEFSDRQIFDQAASDLKARKFDFYFLYLAEFDAFLHDRCKFEGEVQDKIRQYDKWIRELFAQASATNGPIDLFVFSDHGMTPKRGGYDLLAEIRPLGLKMPSDYIAIYDSTMARFWFFNERARSRILGKLAGLDCGRVLTADEIKKFGLDFSDNRFGDSIFLMNPGTLIEPSFMGTLGPEGMHGFDPELDPHSSAVFLTNRAPERPVRTLTDVNAIMQRWIDGLRAGANGAERQNSRIAVSQ